MNDSVHTFVTDSPEQAARYINNGGIVAFPTETVYGLGAGIDHPEAIERIFSAKGRPQDNPLIVHIAFPDDIVNVSIRLTPDAETLVRHFFPGPLTIVVKKKPCVPASVTAGLDTVGIRCPSSTKARELLRRCTSPVAAPSANLSGRPSSTNWKTVLEDLDGKIDCILKGEACEIGLESTIVECSGTTPQLLRAGAVTLEALQAVTPSIVADSTTPEQHTPRSPGLKYAHYAPTARIVTIRCDRSTPFLQGIASAAYIGLSDPPAEGFTLVRRCATLDEYAHALFGFFRYCDERGITTIYCELPADKGLGRAIRDRLVRAANSH